MLDLGSYSDDVSLVKSPRYQKIFLQTALLLVIIDFNHESFVDYSNFDNLIIFIFTFIINTTFTKINGIISGLEKKIKIEKENEIKKKIQDEYNKEIEEINKSLIHDTALHSENIYTKLHKSGGWGKLKTMFKKSN